MPFSSVVSTKSAMVMPGGSSMTSWGRRVPTMVSWPPLDLKTMRWAEVRAEMSTVSSPASPSMVMVLRRRLVVEKSPMISKLSLPAVPAG